MSASPHSFPKAYQNRDVLGELLHSLSQPLTSLRCSLELSLELALERSLEHSPELSLVAVAENQQERVVAALQQTERVIGMIQLMREYLDAEQPGPEVVSVGLEPVLRNVIRELSSIAAVHAVRLCLRGTGTATLPLPESRLRLALQYLIAALIEAQPAGGKVMIFLEEGRAGTVLRGEGDRGFGELSQATSTLRRVRLAIASRVLETAGASLVLRDHNVEGFVLWAPRRN